MRSPQRLVFLRSRTRTPSLYKPAPAVSTDDSGQPRPQKAARTRSLCQHVARYRHWVLGVVVLAWSATAFVSTWVATRIGNRLAGIAVILILTIAIVFNVSKLPYAMWFKVVMLSCFPVACYLGAMRGVHVPKLAADSNTE